MWEAFPRRCFGRHVTGDKKPRGKNTMISKNMFDAKCSVCGLHFRAGEGFYRKDNGGFTFFCKQHVPSLTPTATVSARRLTEDFEIYTPKEPENLAILRSFPGARWNGHAWSVSSDEGDRQRVLELADRLKLDVPPSLRVIKLSDRADFAKSLGLYQYQIEGVDFLRKKKKSLLGDQMGLGKTVQSLISLDVTERVLACVPASLKHNWREEIQKWRPDLKVTIIKTKVKFRWPEAGEVVLINKELLPEYLTPVKKAGDKYGAATWNEFDKKAASEVTLIVDEAHKFKNFKAACSKKMAQLSRGVKKVIALTGTPLLNKPGDLFGVLSSVGMVGEVFGNWQRFKDLFGAHDGEYGVEWGTPSPEVPERLRRVMLARRREDVLPNLPRKQYVNIVVDNNSSITKQLDVLEGEFGDEIRSTNSLPKFHAFSKVRAEIAQNRIPAMLDFVENCEDQDEPLVVFSYHLSPLNELAMRDGWAVITGDTPLEQRQEIVNLFQAGRLKGIGLTIQAGGTGYNLTRANKELFVDMDWVPANNWQAEDRVCRIGQESDKVTIYRMISDHSMDRHVHALLVEKIQLIEAATMTVAKATVPV
jgi:SWI/SNF-related matrix-associated actin-dependent regulator of chromatin subfamily A-like protein 1